MNFQKEIDKIKSDTCGGLVYLASPYSHKDPCVRCRRFDLACHATAPLTVAGLPVFSPIAHSHPIALTGVIPWDWPGWYKYDEPFMEVCEAMIVLTIPGHLASKGVAGEIEFMKKQGKRIYEMQPLDGWRGDKYDRLSEWKIVQVS